MKMLRLSAIVVLVSLSLIVLSITSHVVVQAAPNATCTWIGLTDSTPRNWSAAANWSCGKTPGAGDTVNVTSGGIVINVDVPVIVQNLTFSFAELRGYQPLTVTGIMTWTAGKIAGGVALSPTGALETLVIANGANLILTDGAWERLEYGTLVNDGTVQHGDTGRLYMVQASIDNRAGSTYHALRGGLYEDAVGTAGGFNNAGLLVKQGSGEFLVTPRLLNAGLINVLTDTLKLATPSSTPVITHAGTFSIATAGTLEFNGAQSNFDPPSSLAVSGTLRFANGAFGLVRGAYQATGLTEVTQATLQFEKPGGSVTLPRLTLDSNARLRGTNAITVTGVMTITGQSIVEGTASSSDTLDIAPSATLLINGVGGMSFRTLNNYGSIVQAAGQCFVLSNDAVFNNRSTGLYTVTSGQLGGGSCMAGVTAGLQFNNQGRMIKEGSSTFKVWTGIAFANSGTLDVSGGTLLFDDAFVQTAGETLLRNSSTLDRSPSASSDFIFAGGALRGTGTVRFTMQNSGAVVAPIGLLSINGSYTQGSNGALQIDIGGLTPNTQYDAFNVSGSATLNGRLILSATNGFLPAAGDVFNVMTYGSRSGEFATIDHDLGFAFGPDYQSGGVVVSDNPTLIEFGQKPDRRTIAPGGSGGHTVSMMNPTTATVEAALIQDLPIGFQLIPGSSTSNVALAQPSVITINNAQALRWPTFPITPGATITMHFGVAVTTTVGAYTNTASIVVTPTLGTARMISLTDSVDVSLPPMTRTIVTGIKALAYPPSDPNGLWTISIGRNTPASQVGVIITSTPVCALPACGPLKRFYARSAARTFTMTLVPGTLDRYSTMIPPGQFSLYDPIFLVPVFEPVTPTARNERSDHITAGECERVGYGYSAYFIFDPIDGATPCNPLTGEPVLIDPSGYVTDAQTGVPIKDATVTLYRVPSALPDTRTTTRECRTINTRPGGITGTWGLLPPATANLGLFEDPSFSPATIDPPINPQRTDETGHFGWDVIRGCWYIKAEAPGYFTKYSVIVGVPPEVTDLDIELEPWKKVYLPIVLR